LLRSERGHQQGHGGIKFDLAVGAGSVLPDSHGNVPEAHPEFANGSIASLGAIPSTRKEVIDTPGALL